MLSVQFKEILKSRWPMLIKQFLVLRGGLTIGIPVVLKLLFSGSGTMQLAGWSEMFKIISPTLYWQCDFIQHGKRHYKRTLPLPPVA